MRQVALSRGGPAWITWPGSDLPCHMQSLLFAFEGASASSWVRTHCLRQTSGPESHLGLIGVLITAAWLPGGQGGSCATCKPGEPEGLEQVSTQKGSSQRSEGGGGGAREHRGSSWVPREEQGVNMGRCTWFHLPIAPSQARKRLAEVTAGQPQNRCSGSRTRRAGVWAPRGM